MDKETLRWVGIRFAKLLSYSYSGFLVIVLVNTELLKQLRDATSWELMTIGAIVIGAGVHAFHRSLIVPCHHLLCAYVLWPVWERISQVPESLIPTSWLGALKPPVPFFSQIPAYTALRHSGAWLPNEAGKGKDNKVLDRDLLDQWDLVHAELGLILLTGEGLLVAALLMVIAKDLVCPLDKYITPSHVAWLGFLSWLAGPVIPAYYQHRTECLAFMANKDNVVRTLKDMGFLPKDAESTNNAA